MQINWDAALTALLVTLTVELLLRPYLERRKIRRELLADIVSLAQSARFVTEDLPKDVSREARENFRAEQRRHDEQMAERIQRMYDQSSRYAQVYGGLMKDVLDYIMCLQGVMLSGRPRHRKAEIVLGMAEPAANVFDPRIWRPLRFMNARDELGRRIKATWPDEPVEKPASS